MEVFISSASPFITSEMPSLKPSAAFTASPPLSSMEPARPSTSISPTHAISVDGEWMPKKPLILLIRFEQKPLTLLHSQDAASPIPFQMPLMRFVPMLAICDAPLANPFTMAEMICGTAFTIDTMICGRFLISATKSWTPARMILSTFPTMAFTSEVTIFGIAETTVVIICGKFSISEIRSFTPASMICGMLPSTAVTSPSIICGIAATIAVMISGRAVISDVRS